MIHHLNYGEFIFAKGGYWREKKFGVIFCYLDFNNLNICSCSAPSIPPRYAGVWALPHVVSCNLGGSVSAQGNFLGYF